MTGPDGRTQVRFLRGVFLLTVCDMSEIVVRVNRPCTTVLSCHDNRLNVYVSMAPILYCEGGETDSLWRHQ